MNPMKTLSLAFVMVAGPQILTAIFLATTPKMAEELSRCFVAVRCDDVP